MDWRLVWLITLSVFVLVLLGFTVWLTRRFRGMVDRIAEADEKRAKEEP